MNRLKLFIIGFLLSSLFGYIEWGNNQSMFIFQMEFDLFFGSKGSINSFTHPLIAIPLIGQLILLFQLFYKHPKKTWISIGASCIALLFLLFFAIGLLTINFKILGSSLPYVLIFILFILKIKRVN